MSKTVYPDNHSVAHAWIHRTPETNHGRTSSGNFSYDGAELYSYSTCIALDVSNNWGELDAGLIILEDRHGYSVTTAGKHFPAMHSASSHYQHLKVFKVPNYLEWSGFALWNDWIENELKASLNNVASITLKLQKARAENVKAMYARQIGDYVDNATALVDLIESKLTKTQYKKCRQFIQERLANFDAEKYKLSIEKEEKRQKLEKIKRDKKALADWRAGAHLYLNRADGMTLLRVKTTWGYNLIETERKRVETSKGVKIPLDEFTLAYKLFKRGRLLGVKLAGYTITHIDYAKKVIISGCHTVPFSEVETVAKELGIAQ